jgi:hypothetical protein
MKTHPRRSFRGYGLVVRPMPRARHRRTARTVSELVTELERVLSAHVEVSAQLEHEPFVDLPPAPQRFFDAYESSRTPVEDERRQAYGNQQVLCIEPTIRYAEPTLLSR